MSADQSDCDFAYDDGAYVLGALPPAERAAYERHLATCPACRDAVGELAVLPGLLGRLDGEIPAQIDASPATRPRMPALLVAAQAQRRRERRVNRWRYAAVAVAAACLALVVGLGGAWLVSGTTSTDPTGEIRMVAMQPVEAAAPVRAEIGFTRTGWGVEITMRCAYEQADDYPRPYPFRLVAYGRDGTSEQIGSWMAGPGDVVTVTGATRFSGADLARLELTGNGGQPLLVYDVP